MEFIERTDGGPEPISIARCRELLGEEAESMTDQEIALMRRHAETMACIVIEMYQEIAGFPSRSRASETRLVCREKYEHFRVQGTPKSLRISLRSDRPRGEGSQSTTRPPPR
jgi:hypothetical protein